MRIGLWLALAGVMLFAGVALAQTGTIVGTVVDGQGAPVENAKVMLSGGHCSSYTFTNAQGEYTLANVPVGVYTVMASKMRVGMGSASGVEVRDGEVTQVPAIVLGDMHGGGGHGGGHGGKHPPTEHGGGGAR